ncbi:hypothetical protein [Marinomonas pollencensis]|uniref:Uncharacterized protein n=1 Tax=Marinomonas pollencensis TaxID=491954 RepID=A0A3E0DWV0_9GAMM|nr:hypothetical protein [Marinomonas pollencensis]REG86561.1 hypothetical protein DFP81_101126 [Marinomonas pollencensis]
MKGLLNKVTEKLFSISLAVMLISMMVTVITVVPALLLTAFFPSFGEALFKITSWSSWCWLWSMLPTGIFGVFQDFFE